MTQLHEIDSIPEKFRVNAEKICHNRDSAGRVASGNDSTVYRLDGYVYKIYSGERLKELTQKEILRLIRHYREITNRAAELSDSENWQIKVPYQDKFYPLRVNPTHVVIECTICQTTIGVAPEIEGKTLDQETLLFDPNELKIALSNTSDWISNRLGIQRLELTGNNIKVLEDETMGKYFMVTDLASEVSFVALSTWREK
ncbi:MAG: hypothetical protein UV73_C0001G0125 [Candidatus Gottesmanbacteria bacterium GW2011_GWA2_43_14]|uniref:Uncharacterized protein n=1 Tax=Candidatus Gottesmanbacteria bacterium GW2011_GWA2_43_14 TaxID=1618443 RepID=A0A0G1DLV9_9BACT|nr:MAG: hypothetical protein UV73_C0001G0125 [Candidatus Gottesmanbacteria bacterium GW2011_GWA2_43_14]